jgi:O-antigen ligase
MNRSGPHGITSPVEPIRHKGSFSMAGSFAQGIVLLVPVSFMVIAFRNEMVVAMIKIPLAVAAACVALAVMLVKMIRSRTLAPIRLCTAPLAAFGAVSFLSMLHAGAEGASVKELFQTLVQYLGVYIVIVSCLGSRSRLRGVVRAVTIAAGAVIIYGFVQYAIVGDRYFVGSAFDNRNIFGGYLALVLPLLFGLLLRTDSRGRRWLYGSVIVSGLLVTTSIPSFMSIGAAFVLMILLGAERRMLLLPAVAVFVIAAVVPLGVRVSDIAKPAALLYEPSGLERYHERVERSIRMFYYPNITAVRFGDSGIVFASALWPQRSMPDPLIRSQLNARRKDASFGEGGQLRQRVLEWRAGLNVVRERPVLGVGIGNYQKEIGRFYYSLPKLNTMEPDAQSGYLVILFTSGLAGLATFAWILIDAMRRALKNARPARDPFMSGLSWGSVGSLIAFSINTIFSSLTQQTTAVQFSILLGIVGASAYVISAGREK